MRAKHFIFGAALCVCAFGTLLAEAQVKDHMPVGGQLYGTGRWAAARYEFERAPKNIDSETLAALCSANLGEPAAAARLEALLVKYPESPYLNSVLCAAAVANYDAGHYAAALQLFARVDPAHLSAAMRDEMHFKGGHAAFATGDFGLAGLELSKVSAGSAFALHADYYKGYMAYRSGDYTTARPVFESLANHPSYSQLTPYYLLQMEFAAGNYDGTARAAQELEHQTAMPRRGEIAKIAAQSWFKLENYENALAKMADYQRLGGEMGRAENYLTGYSLYRTTMYRESIDYLARATGADDSLSQNASYHLADAYLRTGDRKNAMLSFSIAAASGHDPAISEDALFNYGKLLYETGAERFNEAVNVLNRYLAVYPDSPRASEAREYLIAAYYNSHDYNAAYRAIAAHPDPDNNVKAAMQKIAYFRALQSFDQGDAAAAEDMLSTAAKYKFNAKYTALTAFWQGEILYARGDFAAAEDKYKEYLRLSPATERENVMARYNIGYVNFSLKNWGAAKSWFDDFLGRHKTRDSYRADALNREGDIEHAQRSYWRAIEKYDAAAAVGTPERYYSAFQRAMMLGLVDRPERKIESLQAIIAKNEGPYVMDAAYELGRTYISRNRYAEAVKTFSDFIEKYRIDSHQGSPYYVAALSNLGLAHLNLGDRDAAMKHYKMVVARAPWSNEARDALAVIRSLYVDAGDVDGYFAYAKKAGILTDVDEVQRDSLSFVAAERIYLAGDVDKAIRALEKYIADSDKKGQYVPTALNYLAGLYFKTERWADAIEIYKVIAGTTTDTDAVIKSNDGITACLLAWKDPDRILEGFESAALDPLCFSEKSRRDLAFAAAGILRERGDDGAMEIYRGLATETRTAVGAESTFRLIEGLYGSGEYDAAEKAVFAFADRGTPHSYWLAGAFLVLGDVYVQRGDTFQARATFQSVVDGYSNQDDGIVAAARKKIAALK